MPQINKNNFYHILDKSLYLNKERTLQEAAFLNKILKKYDVKTILDMGCGDGRVSLPITDYGYELLGIDNDSGEIDLANQNLNSNIRFEVQDFKTFQTNQKFDSIISIYSSFAMIRTVDLAKLLMGTINNLNEKGILILDFLNMDWALKHSNSPKILSDKFDFSIHGIKKVVKDRKLIELEEDGENTLVERTIYNVTLNNGEVKIFSYDHRLRSKQQITEMLLLAGYKTFTFYGDYQGSTFDLDSPRMIIVANKVDTKDDIIDVQNFYDNRNIHIDSVGINNVAINGLIKLGEDELNFQGVAKCGVYLAGDKKGTHMSRMAIGISSLMGKNLDYLNLSKAAANLYDSLETQDLTLKLEGKVIRPKESPITKIKGYELFVLNFIINVKNKVVEITCELEVIGTSLCPASKTNSRYGAHSQRSKIFVSFPFSYTTNLNNYISVIEDSFSSPVFPILKLKDEVFVTESAYENPKFVEDIVRTLSSSLHKKRMRFGSLSCTNYESIHTHNAYAQIIN